jgi:DUF4097 and DUF4098 domain-containing protein YvlB
MAMRAMLGALAAVVGLAAGDTGGALLLPRFDVLEIVVEFHGTGMRVEDEANAVRGEARVSSASRAGWDARAGPVQGVETDTTLEVSPGSTLNVRNHSGEIVIRTWDRSAVRVRAEHEDEDRVKIFRSGSTVKVRSESRYGPPGAVDYEITVPASMRLELSGVSTDISVRGSGAGVQAGTMSGDIDVVEVSGPISLRSVEGEIRVARSRGDLEVNGVESDVSVVEFRGEISLETIDGEIRLENVQSKDVQASTVDGDVLYRGVIEGGGRYRLTTHDGDIVVAMADEVNATVSVATFDGSLEADFPVKLEGIEGGQQFTFVLGDGSARVELQSFDGDIRLVRR